jgi:hypothetical protein
MTCKGICERHKAQRIKELGGGTGLDRRDAKFVRCLSCGKAVVSLPRLLVNGRAKKIYVIT